MTPEKKQGSPNGESVYLAIGFLRRPHGVNGELIMDLHTDFPERVKEGRKIYVGEKREALTIDSARKHAKGMLVKLRGYDSPELAGRFRNQWVCVKASEVPALPAGQVYKHELIGLTVTADIGETLGVLDEILETGANDVYVVKKENGAELLLPAIPNVVLETDMGRRVMKVRLIEGLG